MRRGGHDPQGGGCEPDDGRHRRRVKPLRLTQSVRPRERLRPRGPAGAGPGRQRGRRHFDLHVSYLTDYVFRGIDRSEGSGGFNDEEGNPVVFAPDEPDFEPGAEDAANLQSTHGSSSTSARLPSPFVGLFANVYNDDPINRFQEIRPFVGFEWMIRPSSSRRVTRPTSSPSAKM